MADIPLFTGTVPKRSQSKSDFNKNIVSWLDYTTSLAPAINSVASEIVALSDIQAYSAVATYNYPDDVVRGSDGLTYQCVGTGVSGDNPVGSITGNWVKVTLSESDIADYVTKPNLIKNGNFDNWPLDTTQSADGVLSDAPWNNEQSGSTCVHSQGSFVYGQTAVPNNPWFYSSSVVTSSSGPSNYVRKSIKIDDVLYLSDSTITINFYGKADAAKNICVEAIQFFGDGGSSSVDAIDPQTVSLSTSFVQKTVQIEIPDVTGKTIGDGSHTEIIFWFDAGSDFNSRTNSLGQQSGTFDIAQVKIENGESFTGFKKEAKAITTIWEGSAGESETIDWSSTGYVLSQFDDIRVKGKFNTPGIKYDGTITMKSSELLLLNDSTNRGIVLTFTSNTSSSIILIAVESVTETSLDVFTVEDVFSGEVTGIYGINYS